MATIVEMEWAGTEPEWYHCKGHVTPEEFSEALKRLIGEPLYEGQEVSHEYARNLQTGLSRAEGWQSEIRLYKEHSRGAHPVTVLRFNRTVTIEINLTGAQLRTARIAERCSLTGFARELRVSPSYWSKVERGEAMPSEQTLKRAVVWLYGAAKWERLMAEAKSK